MLDQGSKFNDILLGPAIITWPKEDDSGDGPLWAEIVESKRLSPAAGLRRPRTQVRRLPGRRGRGDRIPGRQPSRRRDRG